jgi:hypothetical protein
MTQNENMLNEDGSYTGPASLSPIPLNLGSPMIKPEDKGKIRANAVEAMHHYASQEMALLKKQADLIMEQVREIEGRLKISEKIYESDMRFTPVIGQTYHLYEKEDHFKLSIIAPEEWGNSKTIGTYLATVKLLGDHSWDVINKAKK